MRPTQASWSLLTRVISTTCSYLHIPRVSRICFSSEVTRVFPKQLIGMFISPKQDLFPNQSSRPDLIISSRFLIHLCQLAVGDPWSLILSSPQSSVLSPGLLQQFS